MRRALRVAPPIVIVVDDDQDVLGSLKFAFEIEGFEVHAHASPEALLACGRLPDRACLVLDHHMPGMNGLALLSRLRERGDDLPAVLITTPSVAVANQAAADGVDIIEKPLLCDTLVSKVRALLDDRRATR
jgi:two-component system response regulator FixJ